MVWLKHDLSAGLTVFLVALPLCLGIAMASGAPLSAGLLSGIVGGVLVSWLSGSPLAVSGPAAGLTTLVASSILILGDFKSFLPVLIVAGLFQLLIGLFKLGSIANYFPSSVLKGMLASIGLILISKQIPVAFGFNQPGFWTSGVLNIFSNQNISGNIESFSKQLTPGSFLVALFSLMAMLTFHQPFFKKLKVIPPPLLAVLAGLLLNSFFSTFLPSLALLENQRVRVPLNLYSGIIFPELETLFSNFIVWKQGILIGLLATLETLLCIEAVDKLDKSNRITPVNRELVAQGIGNMACGFLGALPITAVVVRGAANVDAGARSKLSAFTHGVFLLLAVMFIPKVLNFIPYASLAVILIVTGFNLTKPKLYRNMYAIGLKQFIPFLVTILVILSTDLLIGVSIGLLVSVYFIVQNNFRAEYKISRFQQNGENEWLIKLNSNVTFLNKVNLKKVLEEVPENSKLIIDGTNCNFIDYDILEIISEYEAKALDRKIKLSLKGIEKVNVEAIH